MLHPNNHHYPESFPTNISHSSSSSQSSCSQCKRNTYNIQQESQQEVQGSLKYPQKLFHGVEYNSRLQLSNEEAERNVRKSIGERSFQFEEMLKVLQYEVDALKRENHEKDAVIKELKFLVHKSAVEEQTKIGHDKQLLEINRLRQQLGCSPRNNFTNQQKGFKSTSGFTQNHNMQSHQYDLTQSFNPNSYLPPLPKPNQQQHLQAYNHTIKSLKFQSLSDYELRINFLQKQLEQAYFQMNQKKQCIDKLQQEIRWQQKFIHSFVKMCDQISLTYGEKLNLMRLGSDLKKKTKISWNYMKELVAYFIQAIERNNQKSG